EIQKPFAFPVAPNSLTELNWTNLAAQYGVGLEAPPEKQITLAIPRDNEEGKWGDVIYDFVAPEGYEVANEAKGVITYWGPAGVPSFVFSGPATLNGNQLGAGHGTYDIS